MKYLLLAGLLSACTLAAQPKPGAGSIEGHVLNSLTGEPLRKATVIAILTSSPMRQLADDTDAAGKFQFTGLPPGTYKLSASRAGFLDHAAHRPISLAANEDVADSEIRLPPQGVIGPRPGRRRRPFDGQRDSERIGTVRRSQGRKALSKSAGTGEQVNDRDEAAIRHSAPW
jgi:hypothetical protein